MPRLPAAALSLALIAAPGCDRFDEEGVLLRSDCEQQRIAQLVPRDGELEVPPNAWIVGEVACAAPEATLTLQTQGGQPVAADVTRLRGDRQLRLRPAAPLIPSSRYNARLDTDDGHRAWSFVTSATGTPVGAAVAGLAGAGAAEQGVVLDPAVGASALEDEWGALRPALQLLSDADEGPNAARLGAWAGEPAEGIQDGARSTADLSIVWDDPWFQSEPIDLRLRLLNLPLVLEDAVIGGAVRPGAAGLDGLWIEGSWDTREAEAALGDLCAADAALDGDGCGPCRDGAAACLPFLLVQVPVAPWPGDLVAVP